MELVLLDMNLLIYREHVPVHQVGLDWTAVSVRAIKLALIGCLWNLAMKI